MEAHVDRAVADYHDDLIDKELEKFMDSHNNLWGKSKEDSLVWFNK
jgi:hypothetical protein